MFRSAIKTSNWSFCIAASASLTVPVALTSYPFNRRMCGSVIRMLASSSTNRTLCNMAILRFCPPAWADCRLLIDRDLDDLLLNGVRHQLCLVVNVEFAHEVELMRFDGLHAQAQQHRNLFNGITFRQEFHD